MENVFEFHLDIIENVILINENQSVRNDNLFYIIDMLQDYQILLFYSYGKIKTNIFCVHEKFAMKFITFR